MHNVARYSKLKMRSEIWAKGKYRWADSNEPEARMVHVTFVL